MIIRMLDENHDWQFGRGLQDYATDRLAIEQNIKSRVLSWKNDCFFALDEGVDWQNRLEIGEQATLEAEIKGVILRSFGVVGVNQIGVTFTGDERFASISYEADDIYSESFRRALDQASGT